MAYGSDAPVADPNPFLGFHAAMYRQRPDAIDNAPWHPDERVSLEQVIHGYTLGAAIAGGWDDAIGSIEPGKRADLIILDRDFFAERDELSHPGTVAEAEVLLTIFDGEIVYER